MGRRRTRNTDDHLLCDYLVSNLFSLPWISRSLISRMGSMGPCLGPLFGGWIGQKAGWRWICQYSSTCYIYHAHTTMATLRLGSFHICRVLFRVDPFHPRNSCTGHSSTQSREPAQDHRRPELPHIGRT